jgi:hypothetical protein
MISEKFNPSDPPEKQGSGNQVAVHQPAQLRAPSNPIRLAKAWQVFWKTLLWSYGNLIAWGHWGLCCAGCCSGSAAVVAA